MSLQTLGMVPPDGRVTSSLEMPFELQTNVGGVPGFNLPVHDTWTGTLSAVHAGASESSAALRSTGDSGDERTQEQKFAGYSADCLKGSRLGTTGMASHVDACLDLVAAGVPAHDATAVAAVDEIRRRCAEGWSMLAVGTGKSPPPDFVSSCAHHVLCQPVDLSQHPRGLRGGLEREDRSHDCDFVGACLPFALNHQQPRSAPGRPIGAGDAGGVPRGAVRRARRIRTDLRCACALAAQGPEPGGRPRSESFHILFQVLGDGPGDPL
jgi:hypothetical protein